MRCDCWKILAAFSSRLFLSIHATLMIAATVMTTENKNYSWFLILVALLFVEMAVTLRHTKKGEWKWFSPMVFLYLCCIIPSVFVMELELTEYVIFISNITGNECKENETSNLNEEKHPLCKENEYVDEMKILEQLLIMVLVIGRWLMPKGDMTRDQLAQLLLLYLALGADILDILLLIKEPKVKTSRTVAIVGLSVFSWAVLQFTIVLTQTESHEKTKSEEESQDTRNLCIVSLCSSEMWSVLITVGMQDGPFLVFRTYLLVYSGVENDLIIFFICKNILTIVIQISRIVLFLGTQKRNRRKFQQTKMTNE